MKKPNTKPVPKPPAQYSKLFDPGFLKERQMTRSKGSQVAKETQITWFDALYSLMSDYGLRVSEVLSLNGSNISKEGIIFIYGKKNSNNRTIRPVRCWSYFEQYAGIKGLVFDSISRFTVYREFLKRNITFSAPGRKRLAVTHSCRHILIDSIRSLNIKDSDVKHFTGHKSEKSVTGYGKRCKK